MKEGGKIHLGKKTLNLFLEKLMRAKNKKPFDKFLEILMRATKYNRKMIYLKKNEGDEKTSKQTWLGKCFFIS